jgi:hypothetical protein
MRWSRTLVLPVLLLLLLAACGGPGATDGNGNGNGNGGDESQAEATATPESEESEDDGGNGGNGGDLEQLAEDLTPPNTTETSRTTAGGIIFITWESTDSPEDVADWYEDAIADQGMDIFSRTSASGAFSFIFGIEEGSDFGGVVSIAPSGTGGGGSGVGLQIGEADS